MAEKHVVPGEYKYDGVKYFGPVTKDNLDKVKAFKFRDDDTLVCTYPKTGTHWMRVICEEILAKSGKAPPPPPGPSGPKPPAIIEFGKPPDFKVSIADILGNLPSPRLILTHLGAEFFENNESFKRANPKVIVVMRNIKDTLVSYYHYYQMTPPLGSYKGSFEDFIEMYKTKELVYGDFYDFILGYNQHRNKPNYHFFKYEDMKKDPNAEIKRVAEMLGAGLTDAQIDEVANETSFGNMKEKIDAQFQAFVAKGSSAGPKGKPIYYLRKGVVGDWENYFTPELQEVVDKIEAERMKDPKAEGLEFVHSL